MKQQTIFIALTATLALLWTAKIVRSCNEIVCASIVSKCMLTQSCKCDLKNCSCCKECFQCLGYLYSECCSCVDMCPKPNETQNALSKESHIGELNAIPGLFSALTEEPEYDEKWTIFTFPVDFDTALYGKKEVKIIMHSADHQDLDANPKENILTVNCTVAYMSQCMSWVKCKETCQSMGASSYRWFHDGCCECVGNNCINYGINDSRCLSCPDSKENFSELEDPDLLDYGEGMDPLDVNVANK